MHTEKVSESHTSFSFLQSAVKYHGCMGIEDYNVACLYFTDNHLSNAMNNVQLVHFIVWKPNVDHYITLVGDLVKMMAKKSSLTSQSAEPATRCQV